jgi:hypothetical protein
LFRFLNLFQLVWKNVIFLVQIYPGYYYSIHGIY